MQTELKINFFTLINVNDRILPTSCKHPNIHQNMQQGERTKWSETCQLR